MKRYYTLLALVACLTFSLHAQVKEQPATTSTTEAVEVTDGPMTFEQTTIDYGTIQQNADPYRVFNFKNTGDQPLIITNAVGSCGCTVPSYSKAPIAPGGTGEVKVRYDTNRLGRFRKRVTLSNNLSEEPVVLTIMGEVLEKPAQADAVPEGEAGMFGNGQ
jgi:hypothetical protein